VHDDKCLGEQTKLKCFARLLARKCFLRSGRSCESADRHERLQKALPAVFAASFVEGVGHMYGDPRRIEFTRELLGLATDPLGLS
jgi:hypothetical protein